MDAPSFPPWLGALGPWPGLRGAVGVVPWTVPWNSLVRRCGTVRERVERGLTPVRGQRRAPPRRSTSGRLSYRNARPTDVVDRHRRVRLAVGAARVCAARTTPSVKTAHRPAACHGVGRPAHAALGRPGLRLLTPPCSRRLRRRVWRLSSLGRCDAGAHRRGGHAATVAACPPHQHPYATSFPSERVCRVDEWPDSREPDPRTPRAYRRLRCRVHGGCGAVLGVRRRRVAATPARTVRVAMRQR